MSQASSEQTALKPTASQNLHATSERWNLAANGYGKIQLNTQALPAGTTAEFWVNIIKGSAPIQMMKPIMTARGLAEVLAPSGCEPVEPHSESTCQRMWREKEKLALAWLEVTLCAEGAAGFGCVAELGWGLNDI